MKKNYARAFKILVAAAVLLALCSAIAVPLSLSRQIRDAAALEQTLEGRTAQQGEGHEADRETLWKEYIPPLSAANYAVIGASVVLWLAWGVCYWLLTAAWLYKSAVNEGMNKSLWAILGLLVNLAAVFAFLIVRDNPRRVKATAA